MVRTESRLLHCSTDPGSESVRTAIGTIKVTATAVATSLGPRARRDARCVDSVEGGRDGAGISSIGTALRPAADRTPGSRATTVELARRSRPTGSDFCGEAG